VNDLPSIKAVLEHYGAVIRRDHGQANLKCPFHGDSHQSGTANLDDNLFVCFACVYGHGWCRYKDVQCIRY
jgi:DNA primase